MKGFLLTMVLIFAFLISFSQKTGGGAFTLAGSVVGQDTGMVHLYYTDASGKLAQDSMHLEKGAFSFKGNISAPTEASFVGNVESYSVDDPNFTSIFLEPADMQAVLYVNDFKHGEITGSQTNNEWMVFTHRQDSMEAKWKPMWTAVKKAQAANDTAILNPIYTGDVATYRVERYNMFKRFIRQYPQSYVTPGLLLTLASRTPLDTVKQLYSLLPATLQQTSEGREVYKFIRQEEITGIGKKAPDFTQANLAGKPISLHNYQGKYVLLEFWASWCGPCREELPNLKKAYESLSGKNFTILSISLDKEKDNWLAAVKEEGLTWTQLCDFKAAGNDAVIKYGVASIPANFLISPEGKIIARDLRGEDVESQLAALIK